MRYLKKLSLVIAIFSIFVALLFFLTRQLLNHIEFQKLENINKINLLEEKIINNNDLLNTVNKIISDVKNKQDYLFSLNDSSKDDLLIREIDRLLFLADCQLSICKNIEGAISILESVILLINKASQNNLSFNELVEDIKIDISTLREIHIADFVDIMNRLNKLSDLIKIGFIDKEIISDDKYLDINVKKDHIIHRSLFNYYSFLENGVFDNIIKIMKSFTTRLSSLIELRKVDDLTNINYKHINLLLIQQISIAQFYLVMNQPFLLKSSVNYIIEIINMFFDKNSTNVLEALSIARDINSIDIENKLPNISRSLNSIKKYLISN